MTDYPPLMTILVFHSGRWDWTIYEEGNLKTRISSGCASKQEDALAQANETRVTFLARERAYHEAVSHLRAAKMDAAAKSLVEFGRKQNYRIY
jgi:hypothetical protein